MHFKMKIVEQKIRILLKAPIIFMNKFYLNFKYSLQVTISFELLGLIL